MLYSYRFKRITLGVCSCLLYIACAIGVSLPHTGFALPTPPATNLSLEFDSIDIRKALQILAKFMDMNVVIEEGVQGRISIHLSQVSTEEAVEAILHMNGLTQKRIGKTWIVQPQTKLTTADGNTKPHIEAKRITLKHREAKDIAAIFLGNSTNTLKPQHSELSIDTHSNSLWIQDTSERIRKLEQLVQAFDHPIKQILIEARIVSIDRGFEQTLGARLGLNSQEPKKEKSKNPLSDQEAPAEPPTKPSFNIDLPGNKPIKFGVPLFWKGNYLDLELAAMENEGSGRIISSPHLVTSDRKEASIEAGSEIPYQEKNRYGNTLIFKKAVLSLKVTPEVTATQKVLLKLHLNHDTPRSFVATADSSPPIDTQELKTQVIIQPGETVILGGIYEKVEKNKVRGVPILRKIPILNSLFRYNDKTDTTRELLIFITPRLVSDALSKTSSAIKQRL